MSGQTSFPSVAITDSTVSGRGLLTSADAPAQRSLLGVYSSSETDSAIASGVAGFADTSLSNLSSAATARSNLGLGSAATQDVGVMPGDACQITQNAGGDASLPAISGEFLTNLPASGVALDDDPTWTGDHTFSGDVTMPYFNNASPGLNVIACRIAGVPLYSYSNIIYPQSTHGFGANIGSSSGCSLISGGFRLGPSASLQFGFAYGTGDVKIYRGGAGILSQYNGSNTQIQRLYNSRTDGSNYERFSVSFDNTDNLVVLGAEAAGTGDLFGIKITGDLPTSDPSVANQLYIYNDGTRNILCVS